MSRDTYRFQLREHMVRLSTVVDVLNEDDERVASIYEAKLDGKPVLRVMTHLLADVHEHPAGPQGVHAVDLELRQ